MNIRLSFNISDEAATALASPGQKHILKREATEWIRAVVEEAINEALAGGINDEDQE